MRYDLVNNLISFFQHKKWRQYAMYMLQMEKGAKALDLCCGTGDWTILIASAVGPAGEVYGMDFSENMLAWAQEKVRQCGLHHVSLLQGNVTSTLPFADNYFDYVTVGFGLRNVSDYRSVVKEVKRVLKPCGKLACLETSKPSVPGFKQMYLLYLRYFVPLLGVLLSGSYKEYLWLYESTISFPDKAKLAELFRETGYRDVHFASYWGGTVAIHLATKQN